MSSRWPFPWIHFPRLLALAAAVLVLGGRPASASLKVHSSRALDDGDRTSLMLLVQNSGEEPVTIHDLLLGGKPIQEQMVWDPEDKRKLGDGLDWFDIRPRTIQPGKSGIIILGYITRERREPVVALEAITSAGKQDLTTPPPKPQTLQIASVAFEPMLDRLTVFVRNDGVQTAEIKGALFNGETVPAKIKGGQLPPGKLAVLELALPEPAPFASHCNLLVQTEANGATALAWFRAYPAEMVTYGFYSNHASPADLAENNIDTGVTHIEAETSGAAERMDHNQGQLPPDWIERLATRATSFGQNPKAWAWYMHDDSAWGRPRPQSLVDLGRFLREHGSEQRQILCNPADHARYAWVSDSYLNYSYHTTHQAPDPALPPTAHQELNRFTEIIQANEPLPVFFLVDAVGQNARWITPAEEEIASWMMIGRGIRHPGWFLMASLWQQGRNLGGGIDPLETMPWRYQEGARACLPVWNTIGNIAAQFKALAPYILASAPFGGHLHESKIEVLPLLCRDDVIITVLLNRQVKSTYPRDFPDGSSSGRFDVVPHRNFTVRFELPNGARPVRVFAFDHDRGLRAASFRTLRDQIEVQVDALDTTTVLVMSPTPAISKEIEARMRAAFRPAVGAVVRPHTRLPVEQLSPADEERRNVEFHLAAGSLDKLVIRWDTPLQNAWLQARDRPGRLAGFSNLLSNETAAVWTLPQPVKLPATETDLRVFLSEQDGRITEVVLREHPARPRLLQIARVPGQIETLASSPDGRWLLAGAGQVYAFTGEGNPMWKLEMGENRRQPEAHGPGRNIEQVAIREDGRFGFARTFRYAPQEREYQNSHLIVLRPDGELGERIHCDWRSGAHFAPDGSIAIAEVQQESVLPARIDPRTGRISPGQFPEKPGTRSGDYRLVQRGQGAQARTFVYRENEEVAEVPLPPYPLHQLLTRAGGVVVATTQGIVQATDQTGEIVWTERRLERIDSAVLLEPHNLVAIAYKRYTDRSSWRAVPVLELISLADGSRAAIYEGSPADDFGHYGTPLVLSVAREAGVIFMGDSAGRLYAQPF